MTQYTNRCLFGDCLELMKDIPDKSVDMILTDLPYGVTARNGWDQIIDQEKLWSEWNRIKKENTPTVLTAIEPLTSFLIHSNLKEFRYDLIYSKSNISGFLNSHKQPLRTHENILIFYIKQPTYNPIFSKGKSYSRMNKTKTTNYHELVPTYLSNNGKRYPRSIIHFSNNDAERGLHPTQKSVELFEYLIKTYTNEGDLVLDCCAGSGTTAIACINTNRNYLCIEKEQKYFDIMLKRISKKQNHKLEVFCN